MKRKYLLFVSFLLLLVIGWVGYIFISKPDLNQLRKKIEGKTKSSEVAERETYDSLVTYERNNNISFLNNEALSSEIWNNSFPYQKTELDLYQTQKVLEILNDTSNYQWGETGTPEFDKTIIYYNGNDEEIGYTIVTGGDGEAKSYPYRSLTKWGALSSKGHTQLAAAISQ